MKDFPKCSHLKFTYLFYSWNPVHLLKLYPYLNILVCILINIYHGKLHVDQITKSVIILLVCFIELGSTCHRRALKFCIIQFCFQKLTIVMIVWGNSSRYFRDRIKRLQTRSARDISQSTSKNKF